jgi:hypothetical protein
MKGMIKFIVNKITKNSIEFDESSKWIKSFISNSEFLYKISISFLVKTWVISLIK